MKEKDLKRGQEILKVLEKKRELKSFLMSIAEDDTTGVIYLKKAGGPQRGVYVGPEKKALVARIALSSVKQDIVKLEREFESL